MQDLRRALRQGGIELKVVKNTLLKRAAEDAGQPDLMQIIEGPIALAISYGDVIEASRALTGFLATAPQGFAIRGGYMDGSILTLNDLRDLVRIPARPVLIAMILGQLQSPLAGFIGLLFIIPGVEWTLRVNGRATLVRDDDVREELAAQGVVPELAIAVEVEEAFLHCPKCFLRAKLWDTDEWMPREEQPSFAAILKAQTKYDDVPVEAIAQALATDEKRLY